MKNVFTLYRRVYIRFGESYFNKVNKFDDFNFLLQLVAESVSNEKKLNLFERKDGKNFYHLGATKIYIANEATKIIRKLPRDTTNFPTMKNSVSKKQIKHLQGVLEHKKCYLSCYSIIILLVIVTNITPQNAQKTIQSYPDFRETYINLIIEIKNIIINLTQEISYYVDDKETKNLSEYVKNCEKSINETINEILNQKDNGTSHLEINNVKIIGNLPCPYRHLF